MYANQLKAITALAVLRDWEPGDDMIAGSITVPFRSIRQSRVTGHFQTPKSHGGHGDFGQLPKPLKKS